MQDLIAHFFAAHSDLSLVVLYGSQASGQATQDSDVDVGIMGAQALTIEQLLEFSSGLRLILGREIDLVDLRASHGALLSEILSRGKLLVMRDPAVYAALIKRMWYETEDDGRFLAITLKERQKQWQK